MPYDNRRPDRVAEAIREEVATFLHDGVKDPRVRGLVTVTGVDVTRDLRHAKVYVSIMGTTEGEADETLDALGGIAHHLRGRIGRSLRLRVAPELHFTRDQSVARAARIETLLEQIKAGREGAAPEGDGNPAVEAVAEARADAAADSGADGAGDAPREA
jgi:ribosome-binding factor A